MFVRPCWQEVGPDVERLVVHLKAAEETVQGWALGVAVPRDDAVLPEHLRTKEQRRSQRHLVNLWNVHQVKK